MIVVIVAEKHGIDARKILPPFPPVSCGADQSVSGLAAPTRRVCQNMAAALLEGSVCVVDADRPQLTWFHALGRFRLLYVATDRRIVSAGW